MANNKVVVEFELQGNAPEKTQSLRAQMRQLREELGRLPEGTAEYNKVAKQLGELTDKVGDLGREVNTLAGDPLERLNNSFGMIGSSLMSLDFGGAITGLNGVTGAVKEIKFKDVAEGVKNVGNSFANLGKALLTNPFFLIAGTIALIAMNFDKLLKMFPGLEAGLTGINEQERELAESAEARAKASQDAFENIDKQSNILKLQGKTEKEIAQLKLTALKTAIAEAETRLGISKEQAESQIAAAERNRKILDGIIQFITSPLQVLLGTIDAVGNALGQNFNLRAGFNDMIGDLVIDPEEINNELNAGIKEQENALLAMKNNYAGIQLQIRSMDQKTASDKANANEEANKKIEDDQLKTIKSRGLTRLELERTAAIDISKMQEDLAKSRAATEIAIEEQKRQTILEGEIALKNARLQIAQQVLGGLTDLNSILTDAGIVNAKKSFQINKALGIAQASITTYEGAANAFTTASKSPIAIAFPGYPALMAGIAVAAGLAKVAKIAATKFNPSGGASAPSGGGMGGGGGAMGGGGMGGSTAAPSLDLSFLNNGQTKAQPIQSYVLATNVTSAQDAQQKIIDQSKLIK
jgi:hypothetical protein